MPSKSKKQSNSKSRLSKLDASPSPARSLNPSSELGEDELLSCIEEVSDRFPSFIGKNAFVGRVSGVVSHPTDCKVWLSKPSMEAYKIAPSSSVSVSLLQTGSRSSGSFPLSPLIGECSGQYGIDSREESVSVAGSYFVIATVASSLEVLKDGVRLSSNVSNSLGCPASGRVVFVCPVQIGSQRCHSYGDENSLLSHTCKQLYLKPFPFKRVIRNSPMTSPLKASSGAIAYQYEESEVSSPQTPSRRQSASSLCINGLSLTEGLDGSPGCSVADSGALDVKEMFADETVKEFLEKWAASWLVSRSLLCKNIVTFSSLAELCVFQVVHAEKLSTDNTKSVEEDSDAVFIIDRKTKVSIGLPSDLVSEASEGTSMHNDGIDHKGRTLNTSREVKKLGGLWKEYGILKDIISSPVKNALSGLGLRPPKGVLLYGPPGTGKTSLAQLCAYDAGVNFFKVNGPEVISQYYGESEQELHKVFDAASKVAPAVIFIDELDAIAPARKEGGEDLSQRMVATLLNLMDGISRNEGLLIIAATNRIESIEPALRRPGRLDREIEIGVPSAEQRLDILSTHLNSMAHSLQPGDIQHLAVGTHGFVGADVAALCNEAAMVCLRRYIERKTSHDNVHLEGAAENSCSNSSIVVDGSCCLKALGEYCLEDNGNSESTAAGDLVQSPDSVLSTCSGEVLSENGSDVEDASVDNYTLARGEGILMVDFEDFEKAKLRVRPSAMREVMLEVPRVKWEDVGGQEEVKRQLVEAVVWPQKHHDAFKRIGTSPPTGVLMFGPPGCSKTLMARAVASEAGLNFLAVKGPELFSKWVGESEKAVSSLFAKARANAPSIIFFDEIDSLAVTRGRESDGISVADRVMSQLLVELDGLHQRVNVTVIAATNRPDNIDPALLRPGRFDRLLYVGLPNEKDREDIFHIHLRKMPCSSDFDRRRLAHLTEGFTGADISLICRAAAMKALEESFDAAEIKMDHFEAAIKHVQPTETEPYQNLSERFQRLVSSKAEVDGIPLLPPQSKGSMQKQFWNPFRWISGLIYGS